MSNRDTQFQGFAKLLWEEIECLDNICIERVEDVEKIYQHIARRAYDLVKCVLKDIRYDDERYIDDHVSKLSDLTELPKEQE